MRDIAAVCYGRRWHWSIKALTHRGLLYASPTFATFSLTSLGFVSSPHRMVSRSLSSFQMADPVDQISNHEQGKYHVPVSTPPKDQALTLENFSRDRPLHEAQLHSCAPLQEDHEDQATRRRNVRKRRRSSPVSSTIRRDLIESSSTNVTWPSGSANKR